MRCYCNRWICWIIGLVTLPGIVCADTSRFRLASKSFKDGGMIPKTYTCDGENISPSLFWSGAPKATKSYAIIVTDYDAIYSRRKYMQHWSVYNIPSTVSELSVATQGFIFGKNSYEVNEYRGPCPPAGTTHRYSFQLYALDVESLVLPNSSPTANELMQAMDGHMLDQAILVGKYTRPNAAK